MVKDERFLQEAARAQVEVNPVAGEAVEKMMEAFVSDDTVRSTAPEFVSKK